MHSKIDPRKLPGRYVVKECGDGEFYWHAYLGDERVNGGISDDYVRAVADAKRAIIQARDQLFIEMHYYDVETQSWVKKGELPPL
jgi:hypothetical protein